MRRCSIVDERPGQLMISRAAPTILPANDRRSTTLSPQPSALARLRRFARLALGDLQLGGTPGPQQRLRVARRVLVTALVIATLDIALWARRDALDATFFAHYRMPSVAVPPLREFAAAVERRRANDPDTLVVGALGPSFIWGLGSASTEAIPARLKQKLDATGGGFTALNLAMLRNRYADDRMLAEFFGGLADVVLVPYSAYQAESLVNGDCPSHLDIVEWTGRFSGPFPMPPSCADRGRHAVNAWLEDTASHAWFAYGHRAGLRQLVFPESGDFGATLFDTFTRFIRRTPTRALPPGIDGAPPGLVPRGAGAPPRELDPPGMTTEVELLCRAYAERGTTVLFYYVPTVENPGDSAHDRALVDAVDRAVARVARVEPRCRLVELHFDVPLDSGDYFDRIHLEATGFDKVAAALATALLEQRAAGTIRRGPPRK